MSIVQIELADEILGRLKEKAAARNLDLQSWLQEYIEAGLNETEVASPRLAQKMDEALASGPPISPNDEWWANLERASLELRDTEAK